MITIEYCEEGQSISDFSCSHWLYDLMYGPTERTLRVSTSLPIAFVRFAIVCGELNYENITFLYNGHSFQANKYGAIQDWPKGFCDRDVATCEDILRVAMKKRKEEKEEKGVV